MPSWCARASGSSATIAQIAGTIAAVDIRKSARGNRFAFVRLSDPTGLFEARMFSDVLDAARDHLEPGRSVVLTVEATLEGDELKLLARAAQPIDVAVAGAASAGLRIFIGDALAAPSLAARLDQVGARRRVAAQGAGEPGADASRAAGRGGDRAARALSDEPAGAERAEDRGGRRAYRGILRPRPAAAGRVVGVLLNAIAELVPLGLAVALSPLPVIAVTLLLSSPQGPGPGVAFSAGWVAGLALATTALLFLALEVGALSLDLHAWSEIVIGTALLVAAAWKWATRPRRGTVPTPPRWVAALARAGMARALALGLVFGGVNPKNLALALIAVAAMAYHGLEGPRTVAAVSLFVAVGSLTLVGATLLRLAGGAAGRGVAGGAEDLHAPPQQPGAGAGLRADRAAPARGRAAGDQRLTRRPRTRKRPRRRRRGLFGEAAIRRLRTGRAGARFPRG